jgi:flagellar hook-associated protein 2
MAISGTSGNNYLASSSSGLDTTSIINQLVQIEAQPITALQKKQSNLKSQASLLGNIAAQLSSFNDAAQALSSGVVQVGVSGTYSGFTAAADSSAAAGNYSVQVTALAQAAKVRSQGFTNGGSLVSGGALHFDTGGTGYDVTVTDGTALSDLVAQINATGAPVNAAIISDGSQSYLSITNRNTGYDPAGTPAQALAITFTAAGGSANPDLAFSSVQPAANAALTVDNLPITSQSNDVSSVIPGVTLTLKALTSAPESLALSNDQAATAKGLQTFVDTYNRLVSSLEAQLHVDAGADRSSTLAGDASVRGLQQQLQALFSTSVPGLSQVRSLADLGITTQKDGSITLDTKKLNAALALNPDAVNQVFSKATTGIAAASKSLLSQYTDSINGVFTLAQQGYTRQVKDLDSQVLAAQEHATQYRTLLVSQFSAMEAIVSGFKSASQYLTNLTNQLNGSNK